MYQRPLGIGGIMPQMGALPTGLGQVPGIVSPLGKQTPIGVSPLGKQAPIGATPWGKQVPAVAPASCSIMYGPVANVCQSAVPVTKQVPVTTQVPITTVTPIPTGITPEVYASPTPGLGAFGKGIAPTVGATPWGKAPLRPGAYTTEAKAIL